jgi:hypothetical protein
VEGWRVGALVHPQVQHATVARSLRGTGSEPE